MELRKSHMTYFTDKTKVKLQQSRFIVRRPDNEINLSRYLIKIRTLYENDRHFMVIDLSDGIVGSKLIVSSLNMLCYRFPIVI